MLHNRINLILICFLLSFAGYGQEETVSLSFDQAMKYALEHNRMLANARDGVKIAEEQIKETRAAHLPQVEGSVDYMTNFNYEFELNFSSGSSEPPQINNALLDEGDLEVLSFIDQMFGSSESSAIIMTDQANATVQVSQLVFNGQYWIGLQMARLAKTISEKNVELTERDVKEQVGNTYYLILMTKELLEVLTENTQNLEEIYTHTNNMYKAGLAEQTDADLISIQLSQLRDSKNETERNLEYTYNMLRFLLGLETGSNIILTDDLTSLVFKMNEEVLNIRNLDLGNNPEYQMMMQQEEIGTKKVRLQKWANAPTLVSFYSYKEKLLTSGFDLSPNNAAGMTLSVPIYAGGTKRAQLSQAKIELDQIQRNRSMLEDQLRLQDKQLNFNLRNAYDNYLTQKENVEVAKRVYTSYQNKFRQGLVSGLELTQSNSSYLQAESNYISAMMKLLQSKLALDKLYNNI